MAAQQAAALDRELQKIDIHISEEEFTDTHQPTFNIDDERDDREVKLVPDVTVQDDDVVPTTDRLNVKFESVDVEVEPRTIMDPVTKEPFEPRTLKKEDIDISFDPSRPDFGSIIGMTDELKERIKKYYYDKGEGSEMVFFLTPEEVINLASAMNVLGDQERAGQHIEGVITSLENIENLQESIFGGEEDSFDFDPLSLTLNLTSMEITGHEGRHRSFATFLQQQKTGRIIKLPVSIQFTAEHPSAYNPDRMHDYAERPDVIPDVPAIIKDVRQELSSMQSYPVEDLIEEGNLKYNPPVITRGSTLEEYSADVKRFYEEVDVANEIVRRKRQRARDEEEKLIKDIRDSVTDALDQLHDNIMESLSEVEDAYDDDDGEKTLKITDKFHDALFGLTSVYKPERIDDDVIGFDGDDFLYNVKNKELIIKAKGQMLSENLQKLIEKFKPEDIDFTITVHSGGDYDERDLEYMLSFEEEDQLVQDILDPEYSATKDMSIQERDEYVRNKDRIDKLLADMKEEVLNSDNEYTGNVTSDVTTIDIDKIIDEELD